MIRAPQPRDEAGRVRTLREMGVMLTPDEERFDRLTRLVVRLLRVPIALVSLGDARVQWFKSTAGTDLGRTSRSVALCGQAILGDEPLVVRDMLEDDRFRDSPLVTGEPRVRFYAGQPLRGPDGRKVGTLCAIDTRPRRPSADDLRMLADIARLVEDELKATALREAQSALIAERDTLRRRSMLDPLTRMWNHGAVLEVLQHELTRAERQHHPLSVIMADLDHFKRVNDAFGHPVGDGVLVEVARRLRASVRPYDAVGRYGGEEFLVVLPDCDRGTGLAIAERMRRAVERHRFVAGRRAFAATLSLGVATNAYSARRDRRQLVRAADRALYAAKAAGRNRVVAASTPARGEPAEGGTAPGERSRSGEPRVTRV